jgi:hypothetical protein
VISAERVLGTGGGISVRLLLALLLAFWPFSAAAQDRAFPYDQLATSVVGESIPEGWVFGAYSMPDPAMEMGEYTPAGQELTRWRDLLSYLTAPVARRMAIEPDAVIAIMRPSCASMARFDLRPSVAEPAERWFMFACYTLPNVDGGDPDAPLQIYQYRTLQSGDGLFDFWRAWRGRPDEVAAMLRRYGVTNAPRISRTPSNAELESLAAVMPQLSEAWGRELAAAFTVCDLARATPSCAPLNNDAADIANVPVDPRPFAAMSFTGDHSRTDPLGLAHGESASLFLVLQPSTHDFRSADRLRRAGGMVLAASKDNGGALGVAPDQSTDAPEMGRLRAYLLKLSRMLVMVPNGLRRETLAYDLWR